MSDRKPSAWWVVGGVTTFLASVVAAGHGVAPVLLLLVMGWEYWLPHALLGWTGIIVCVVGAYKGGWLGIQLLRTGSVVLVAAWCLIQSRSEAFIMAVP